MSVTQLPEPMTVSLNAPAAPARPHKKRGDGRWAALIVFPNLAMFTLFIIVPILGGLYLSFTS